MHATTKKTMQMHEQEGERMLWKIDTDVSLKPLGYGLIYREGGSCMHK